MATDPTADIQIRDVVPGDRDALIALALEANAWEGQFHPNRKPTRARAEETVDEHFNWVKATGGRNIVAVSDGHVVGSCMFARLSADDAYLEPFDRHYGFIAELTVLQAHRGRGIGTLLLAHAERWLTETGVNQIQIAVLAANVDARRLYERVGFSPYELTLEKRLDGRPVPPRQEDRP